MKKAILGGLTAAGAAVGVYFVYQALIPDEARVKSLIERMADGFNASRASRALGGLADGFVDETEGISKTDLHAMLAYLFLKERDPKTKEFRFRVEVGEPVIEIHEPERLRGQATVPLRVLELRKGGFQPVWSAEVEADLEKMEGSWKVRRSRHRGTSGRRPF